MVPWVGVSGLLLLTLTSTFHLAFGQKDEVDLNIFFIFQEAHLKPLLDHAVKFATEKLGVKVGKVHEFDANYNDSLKLTNAFCQKYGEAMSGPNKPHIAIDFTRIGIPSEGVKIALAAMQMPTIAATFGQEGDIRSWRDLNKKQQKYLIQVPPPADVIVQSVRTIVEAMDMTSAVLMFDPDQYEMYHKYKALLQNLPCRHLLSKTETEVTKLQGQIYRLVHVDIVNYFIAGKAAQITEVLAAASKRDAADGPWFSDEFAWYSMTLTPEEPFPTCKYCEIEVTLVHMRPKPIPSNRRKEFLHEALKPTILSLTHMFYFDLAVDAIIAANQLKKEGKYDNLRLDRNNCTAYDAGVKGGFDAHDLNLFPEFQKAAKDNMLKFHLESGLPGKNYPTFELEMVRLNYSTNKIDGVRDNIGTWKAGFDTPQKQLSFEKGKDLDNHRAHTVFRVVTYVQEPFVFYKEGCNNSGRENKYVNCFYGYCIDLLEKIREDLKFNYTIRNVSDGYGYMNTSEHDPDHKWNGMVLELKERRADIALGAMSVMAERESVVDFTVPYYDLVGISVLMKKPIVETSLFKFLTVLENDVWMCILGAYFFTSFLMWIFDRWSPYSYQNNREKYEDDEEKREFNLKECLWFCMTSLTPQGGGEAPKNLSGRLVAATWWLFGFIIIASYTANLAAFLTVSRLDAPIESLDDLSKQYKIQYAPMKGSSAWIYFDRMAHIEHRFYEIWKDMSLNDSMSDFERSQLAVWDYPVSDRYTKMWQAMMENTPPENFTFAVERVRGTNKSQAEKEKDGFAFLDEATNIKWQTVISCDFDQKGEEFSRKPYAIAVQKGSPLKESISHMILKLLNQRYLELLKENWWNNATYKKQCPKEENQSDGISIHNIGGVFIVIFVGIVMACFTLVFEYWWYRKRNVSEELAEMALPPPKEFGSTFTTSPAPTIEKTNFNTQYDKPPERTTLPSIENAW